MEVLLSSKAERQLSKIPPKMQNLIINKIEILSKKPYGSNTKKLINRDGWRYRVGDYRVLYTVDRKKLIILSVVHRKDAYKIKI